MKTFLVVSTFGIVMSNSEDVILWKIPIKSKVHVVEFEHGERTGVRVLRVDGDVSSGVISMKI